MLNKHCEMARLVLGAVLFVAVASALPATPCPPGGSGSGDPEVPKGTSNGTILAPTQVYQPDTHASAETKYTPAELPVRNAAAILRAMRPIDRKRMEKMPTDYQLCYKCMQVSGKDAQEKDQAGSGKDAPGCNWLKGNEEKACIKEYKNLKAHCAAFIPFCGDMEYRMQQRIAGGPTPTKAQQDKIKELLGCVDKRKAAFDKLNDSNNTETISAADGEVEAARAVGMDLSPP